MHETFYSKFSDFLKARFGCRVQKITIDAGFTCPNRDGTTGSGGCIYCNNSGFNVNVRMEKLPIEEQIRSGIAHGQSKGHTKFIAYFQPFSNTYAPVDHLRQCYDTIRRFPEVVGLSIGTRPDCVDREKLALINSYTNDYMVWIEYGLQTIHDRTLALINRGHSAQCFRDTIALSHEFPQIRLCVHVILGLPGETRDDMLETARQLSRLPIHGIKLHPLHVVKDTVLAAMVEKGACRLLSFDEYVGLACDFLELLPPGIVVQRITADAPDDLLIGPSWVSRKMATLNAIDNEFRRRGTRQGGKYSEQ